MTTGLPTLTSPQPHASLVAERVKWIIDRSWPAPEKLIGQHIGVHAGARQPRLPRYKPGDPGPADIAVHERGICSCGHDALTCLRWGLSTLPLGAIVATAKLTACVPMVGPQGERRYGDIDGWLECKWEPGQLALWTAIEPEDVTDQLPYGHFEHGRWAWLLDDIQPTTERCPWCMGRGRISHTIPGVPPEVCTPHGPCPVCWPRKDDGEKVFWDDGTSGSCDPVRAKGAQRIWYWTPEVGRG